MKYINLELDIDLLEPSPKTNLIYNCLDIVNQIQSKIINENCFIELKNKNSTITIANLLYCIGYVEKFYRKNKKFILKTRILDFIKESELFLLNSDITIYGIGRTYGNLVKNYNFIKFVAIPK